MMVCQKSKVLTRPMTPCIKIIEQRDTLGDTPQLPVPPGRMRRCWRDRKGGGRKRFHCVVFFSFLFVCFFLYVFGFFEFFFCEVLQCGGRIWKD